jgi:transposase
MDRLTGVVLGVDTHVDVHVAAALNAVGELLGTTSVETSPAGYAALLRWAGAFGSLGEVGIEGTGSYGVGLARWLRARGIRVLEIDRPTKKGRRLDGKSDALDAEAAARAVLAGTAFGQAKSADGRVEMIRALRLARRSAIKARTQASNQLYALVVTAPDDLRAELRSLSLARLVALAARLRVPALETPRDATRLALRSIARRHRSLGQEVARLDAELARLVAAAAPGLLATTGVGVDSAGALLVACGDNPERLRGEAAFAHLCGAAPLPASSGRTNRHRLSRGGNRDANRALHMVVLVRLRWDEATRRYMARRTAEGRTKPEIIRCLKRYVARQLFPLLVPAT